MRPEPFAAFQQALLLGPGHCPRDLFEGSVPAIVRGLKVHANNISHARHVALEETYPRLLETMGLEAFHKVAEEFLEQPIVKARGLDALGQGFQQLLDDPLHRDLARAEWLWLQSFHAAEAEALTLAGLGALEPDVLLAARLKLHPAARWLELENSSAFEWDVLLAGQGNVILFSRPDANVLARRLDDEAAPLLPLLFESSPVARLLGSDLPSLITLIDAGTVILETSNEA